MVHETAVWKPVQIDGNISAEKIQGLVGIEECTNYDINNFSKVTKRKLMNDKKVNRKKKKQFHETVANHQEKKTFEDEHFLPSKSGSTIQANETNYEELENTTRLNLEGWSSFALPKPLLQALEELKFFEPTQIQSLTLHAAILGRRNIVGAAETGSGKTLAFGLPILATILKLKEQSINDYGNNLLPSSDYGDSDFQRNKSEVGVGCVKSIDNIRMKEYDALKPLYALILTPTRELAIQIKNHLSAVAKYTDINIAVVVGGMAAVKQERVLSKSPEIVVATPGRLWELIQQGNSHLSQIDNIRFLVIDETDRMMERGHFQELHDLLSRINLNEQKKKQRQNFIFSATLTLVHDVPTHVKIKSKIKKIKRIQEMTPAQKLQKIVDLLGITNPKVIDITQGVGLSGTLTECRITCSIEEKDYYVYYFLKRYPGKTLIFCNSIGSVQRLSRLLDLLGCHPLPLHASMQQRQRLKNLERFQSTEKSILVATDVAARGLDIFHVEHVLHYQTPRTSENYIHRSGRTARAHQQGITILLIEPNELQAYLRLCKTLGKSENLPDFPVENHYLNAVKQRVNLAREIDKLQLQVRRTGSEANWLQKAAEEMDIIVDVRKKYDAGQAKQCKKLAQRKMKEMASLLETPIFSKHLNAGSFVNAELFISGGKEHEEKALDAMKNILKPGCSRQLPKKIIPLYKFKNKASHAKYSRS